jgi:hypothetical protein
MSGSDDLTPKILEKIHREIAGLREDTNTRLGDVNQRLDFVSQGLTRLSTDVVELKDEVKRNGARFERSLVLQGRSGRDLEARVTRLEQHCGLGE